MAEPTTILVVDDEEAICVAFQRYFEARGCRVAVASSVGQGLEAYRLQPADVVFLDVRLPDGSGLDALEQIRQHDPDARVIVITAYSALDTVTRAFRNKAFDFLVKPIDLDRAGELVAQAVASRAASCATASSASVEPAQAAGATLVGSSPAMQDVYKRIGKVAQSDATVLIRGDTGTGKELVARAIHEHSSRASNPFVAVNCGALPGELVESELFGYARGAFTGAVADKSGRFEAADGGTLFLDEVGELPLAAQVKLLRFLDARTIEHLGSVETIALDVRVLAATHRNLSKAVEAGQFRADLFYRLAVVQIDMPPLADRVEDILPLARHFLSQWAGTAQAPPPLSDEASALLEQHAWPGNVRELRNAIEHAVIVSGGGPVLAAHLPGSVREGPQVRAGALEELIRQYVRAVASADGPLHEAAIKPLEKELLRFALEETGGHHSAAAERLGLHRNTLRQKLREHGIE